MAFKLGRENRKYRTPENTPIFRKKLKEGVLGEANKDGSIFINEKVKPGSAQEKQVLEHEGQHAKDMKAGVLGYGDDWIRYKGKTYPRKDGKIKYNGKWYEEGSEKFPWEKKAIKAENKNK